MSDSACSPDSACYTCPRTATTAAESHTAPIRLTRSARCRIYVRDGSKLDQRLKALALLNRILHSRCHVLDLRTSMKVEVPGANAADDVVIDASDLPRLRSRR